jgi:hypothetical protein
MIPTVKCFVLFCQVVLGQCVPGGELSVVELREVVTDTAQRWASPEKQACARRFYELRALAPHSDEWPVRFEVSRPERSIAGVGE